MFSKSKIPKDEKMCIHQNRAVFTITETVIKEMDNYAL